MGSAQNPEPGTGRARRVVPEPVDAYREPVDILNVRTYHGAGEC